MGVLLSIDFLDAFWAFFKMPFIWVGFGVALLLWALPKLWCICQDAFQKG